MSKPVQILLLYKNQEKIFNFLKRNRGKSYTTKEISKYTGISIHCCWSTIKTMCLRDIIIRDSLEHQGSYTFDDRHKDATIIDPSKNVNLYYLRGGTSFTGKK